MGWFKLLLNGNNAEGCREAMRMSYKKHLRLALRGIAPSCDSPHHIGLYGALCTRHMTYGMHISPSMEPELWAELAPFLLMSETDAVESLAEYVVYKELPREAKVPWLRKIINDAFRTRPVAEDWLRTIAPMGHYLPSSVVRSSGPGCKKTFRGGGPGAGLSLRYYLTVCLYEPHLYRRFGDGRILN